MSELTDVTEDSYKPSIRRRVNLDAILKGNIPEQSGAAHSSRISSPTIPVHACSDSPKISEASRTNSPNIGKVSTRYPPPSVREWTRPHLVNVDEFRETLLSTARDMISKSEEVVNDDVPTVEPEKISTGPLIQALVQPQPQGVKDVPEQNKSRNRRALTRSPSRRRRADSCSPNRRREGYRRSPTRSPDILRRATRIAEQIAARTIINEWKERRAVVPAEAEYREEKSAKKIKKLLKEVMSSALTNSKLIREELSAIHSDLNRSHTKRVDLITGSPVVISSPKTEPEPSEIPSHFVPPLNLEALNSYAGPSDNILAARILLRSSVSSPGAVEEMLNALTRKIGRGNVKMCIGQITVHPKALVLVVKCNNSLKVEDWIDQIQQSQFIDAYDEIFPNTLTGPANLPWEIRIKSSMTSVLPRWVATKVGRLPPDTSIR
jgi:hypothetical protein